MSLADCKTCKNEIIENEANGKIFYYCRTCKDERTVWGFELAKPESTKPVEERKVYAKLDDDLYGTYGGGHNQSTDKSHPMDPSYDPYYGYGSTIAPGQSTRPTQKEIDELFNDMYQGAD